MEDIVKRVFRAPIKFLFEREEAATSKLTKSKKRLNVLCCTRNKEKSTKSELVQEVPKNISPSKESEIEIESIRHTEEDFICPICLKFMAKAVTILCGHLYCELCLDEYLHFASECLICDRRINRKRGYGNCKTIDSLIENMLVTLRLPEELEDLQKRRDKSNEFFTQKKVGILEVGTRVDIQSPEQIWCSGIVKRIFLKAEKKDRMVSIHFEGFPSNFDEELPESSGRLARHGFYSSRPGSLYLTI